MAQTGSCFVSPPVRPPTPQSGLAAHAAPFPLPPGLPARDGASPAAKGDAGGAEAAAGKDLQVNGSSAGAKDHIADQLSQLRPNSDRQAIIDAVRQAVLRDVDSKVADKVKDLWSRGRTLLGNIEQENQKKATEIGEVLVRCQEKQEALQSENDRLKATIAGLVHQFSMLGSVCGGSEGAAIAAAVSSAVGAAAPSPAAAATASPATVDVSRVGSSSSQEAASAELFAPGAFPSPAAASTGAAGATPLPEVPAWPFPVAPPVTPATPLSLSEALGQEPAAQQQVPLSLMGSLPAARTPAMEPALGSGVFSFTLRKADGTDLGLNVSHHEDDKVLRVEGVRPEGAVEAWNRQCQGSAACEKAVIPGDRIISVNSIIYEPLRMLEECKVKQLLKLTIVRGDHPLPGVSAKAATSSPSPAKTTTLRADASEFVPTGAPGLTPTTAQQGAADESKADSASSSDKAPSVV
mmetsp:Transcript_72803/g.137721  ORF Transcript_72803/g.137721 Transcript_72803/m.137721 type:complete len:465 (+) Transcript_72803:144-1538(+)